MKTIIIILTIFTNVFYQQTVTEKELLGTWTPTKAIGETNKPCDKNSPMVKDFKLKFLSSNNYEMIFNPGTLIKTTGKYTVDLKNKTIILTYKSGASSYNSKIPIITFTKDMLVIKYNLCATYDTTSVVTGRLELKKTP